MINWNVFGWREEKNWVWMFRNWIYLVLIPFVCIWRHLAHFRSDEKMNNETAKETEMKTEYKRKKWLAFQQEHQFRTHFGFILRHHFEGLSNVPHIIIKIIWKLPTKFYFSWLIFCFDCSLWPCDGTNQWNLMLI